jgi:hypothetical protein
VSVCARARVCVRARAPVCVRVCVCVHVSACTVELEACAVAVVGVLSAAFACACESPPIPVMRANFLAWMQNNSLENCMGTTARLELEPL